MINPTVLTDEGCAADYVKALDSSGVDARKRMADLINFGCIESKHGVFLMTARQTFRAPNSKIVFLRGALVFDSEMYKNLVSSEEYFSMPSQPDTPDCLVDQAKVEQLSREAIKVILEVLKAERAAKKAK